MMLDAFTRYSRPKLIRRQSSSSPRSNGNPQEEQNRRISAEESWTALESPELCSAAGSSAGSFLSSHNEDSQRNGKSLKQTFVNFRRHRLRPLSVLTITPKFIRNHRPSRSRGSMELIDSEQFRAGAPNRVQSSYSEHSSHVIPRSVLQYGGHYAKVDSDYVPDSPHILHPPSFMSGISLGDLSLKDDKETWRYSLEGPPCEIRSEKKPLIEEDSEGSLDDEMLDTLCTLRSTIQKIKAHRRKSPQSSPLLKSGSLPTGGSQEHINLSRSLSAPCRIINGRPTPLWTLESSALPHCLVSPVHSPTKLPGMYTDLTGNHSIPTYEMSSSNPEIIENEGEDEDEDTSSFCTVSEEEPDYHSGPYFLPMWPDLAPILSLPLDPQY
ncbi:hypothetical protein MJO28_016351 [Puccinia striiformis f. sp. tritici]|uniref:Uncharacterized protein n=3 Tax=Puccinia striiformis TaxID=27350 RepID=A0A0L0VZE0_9BASI|nr:hypothetical protein Pst134EB_031063 [Puccinia striiformis f. sp. tritici]KAI7935480.1 hypothetical protein MJO28_016351 [Puccinia striiformis f. sp. tritici]KAI9600567.1 hypothetical protein H4Q26_000354 [Puccinia striiformis f. sp. tritici PST-130]KNF04623.1 hypothetical protein PSTG_02111 [Puccinia striiformis f. sp. tritici PST-78]